MDYGLYAVNAGPTANRETMVGMAKLAERLGFDSIFLADHVVLPDDLKSKHPYGSHSVFQLDDWQRTYDVIVALTYLAAVTERVRLITSVLVVPQRNPLVTAKQLASLDDLSGGRLVIGVGVGWLEEEFAALGADFHRRGAITDEYLEIYRRVFTERTPSFEGQHYRFAKIRAFPQPAREPRPPIWVGGHTPPALRRAARLGDGWHATRQPADVMRRCLARLRDECARLGRDPAELTISLKVEIKLDQEAEAPGDLAGTPEQVAGRIRELRDLGVDELIIEPRPLGTLKHMTAIVERFWREVRPLV